MGKVLGVLSGLCALVAGALFVLTGAGAPRQVPLAEPLGPWAGSPALAGAAAALLLLAVVLLGRGGAEKPFATREALLVLSVAGAGSFTIAALLGVNRGWSHETLAALAVGGVGQTLVALGLVLRVATRADKRKLLFVPGTVGAVVVGLVQLLIATLGGA